MKASDLYPAIFKRKSFHLFRDLGREPISLEERQAIEDAYRQFSALCPDIRTAIRIVPEAETTCKRGAEYCILLYSEKKEHYLQNIGYLGEQLDLYLARKNIGTLWYGVGKTAESRYENLDFVIMLAVAKVGDETKFRRNMWKSRRKPIGDIWFGETMKGITDIVRFAPSACNTQPWMVAHEGDTLKVYRYRKPGKRGIMPANRVTFYNQMDIGIFLCFLELCLMHEHVFFEKELMQDAGLDDEKTLFAVYQIKESQGG